jgi:hypothetical protein
VRAIQRTQFRAKNAKNDLNPTDLVKHNFCFETEGVCIKTWEFHLVTPPKCQKIAILHP